MEPTKDEQQNQNQKLLSLAFKRLKEEIEEENFENMMQHNLELSVDSQPYEEMDFILARQISGDIRENSALKALTINILDTFKKCGKEFVYEETMKPRRELTFPNEGTFI
jgi:hypothetical protein